MSYRAAFYVQCTEDCLFLRADGEGGVVFTSFITQAMPFLTAEAAYNAVEDHCNGFGVVFRCYQPDRAD